MRVLLLGATGRTGKWVLSIALEKGYSVNALVRAISKVKSHENLTIFEGTPSNKLMLSKAAENCDAIVSVLNISKTSDFPWAKLRTPETFLSKVMQNVVRVSKEYQIERVIVCSAWGVAETSADLPFWFRLTIEHSAIGKAYADHERQEQVLLNSDLNWTIIRPVGLINQKQHQKIKVSYRNNPKPALLISRRSVAEFMVNAIEDNSLIGKSPTISHE